MVSYGVGQKIEQFLIKNVPLRNVFLSQNTGVYRGDMIIKNFYTPGGITFRWSPAGSEYDLFESYISPKNKF